MIFGMKGVSAHINLYLYKKRILVTSEWGKTKKPELG